MSPIPRVAPYERARPLRVAILSDDALLRAALAQSFEGDDVEVTRGDDGAHVALWDWGLLRAGDGAAIASRLELLRAQKVAVVALVPAVADGQRALAAGAKGVLLRDRVGAHLASALFAAHAGLTVLDQAFAERLVGRPVPASPMPEQLTAREREVIALIAEGLSNKRIARRLGISEHTAKFHVNRILEKLGADTRTEAVVRAMRFGMLLV